MALAGIAGAALSGPGDFFSAGNFRAGAGMSGVKAWAQLLRLPNVFTAVADVIAGAVLALGRWPEGNEVLALLRVCLASVCLYSAGMVLNDYFDVEEDARERPFRPIPSGRVKRTTAGVVGFGLLALGFVLGSAWSFSISELGPTLMALALSLMIVSYDGFIKRTVLGPVGMGACRFFNVLLGASHFGVADSTVLLTAGVVGSYVMGITLYAKGEAFQSRRLGLVLGTVIQMASWGAFLVIDLLGTFGFLSQPRIGVMIGVLLLGAVVGRYLLQGVIDPGPAQVQAAVKASILGIIGLDAVIAFGIVGPTGLGLLVILVPALLLGRFVYST
jgi:4-hydroxybenzoate polyprenyltransferase